MRGALIPIAAFALSACGQNASTPQPEQAFAFTAASIQLPTDEPALPAGPSGERITNTCTACHSPDFLMAQPPLKPEVWKTEVAKMRTVYHASIDEADDPALVAALVDLQSKRHP